ncbi:hypothetical protein ACIBG4_32125 [Nonomuraea sp. NPDC050383]|uniref:hypothetical protein n=1 Tax=Nonomuraea sp. NPDC050383 TaxID=3364362 RepID=UPI0037B73078
MAALAFGIFNGASVSDMRPHHMPLGISGPADFTDDLTRLLAANGSDAFDLRSYAIAAAAEDAVRDREVVAAISAESGALVAVIAGGEGPRISQSITALAQQTASETGLPLRTHDVAPLPENDPQGITLATLLGCLLIPGIVGIIAFSVIAKQVSVVARAILLPVAAGLAGLAAVTLLGPGLNVLSGNLWHMTALAALYLTAIIAAGLGMVRVLGMPGIAVVALTTMTLGNATSGASTTGWFLPHWMSVIGPILPPNAFIATGRSLLYFHGVGLTRPLVVLLAWVAVAELHY